MNENLKIYICTHTDFDCPVHNPVYEIVDARTINNDCAENGLHGSFYSELMAYKYLADHVTLPDYVGFCHYRKYFAFMDDVPDVERVLRKRGCVATERQHFNTIVYEQYAHYHVRQDMDLLLSLAQQYKPALGDALSKMLGGCEMHTCNMFIMRRKDFLELMQDVWAVLDMYVAEVGDIVTRIKQHPEWYLHRSGRGGTVAHQYRIGGFLGERLTSAWIMKRFPHAKTYPMIVTSKPKYNNFNPES